MRDLPGFYWDMEKNRYFPLSSKPKSIPRVSEPKVENESSETGKSSNRSTKRKQSGNGSSRNMVAQMRSAVYSSQHSLYMHQMLCSQIVKTSRITHFPIPDPAYGSITAFQTTSVDDRLHMFYGDTNGWLYSYKEEPSSNENASWVPELNIMSRISSINISDSRCVATSFGPMCKIYVQDLSLAGTTGNGILLSPGKSIVHDIWTSHLRGRNLALGANKKAVYVQDIDTANYLRTLDTHSDVFALEQQENLVYTGARNGSIWCFDTRLNAAGEILFDDTFKADRNSVTNLKIVREWQLVIANINGGLGLYDLRFASRMPLLQFSGHQNSYTSGLALAVDSTGDFLFAAGEDKHIRSWSLRSGKAILPQVSHSTFASSDDPQTQSLFTKKFRDLVVSMQVTEEPGGQCLWATAHNEIVKYHLGMRELF